MTTLILSAIVYDSISLWISCPYWNSLGFEAGCSVDEDGEDSTHNGIDGNYTFGLFKPKNMDLNKNAAWQKLMSQIGKENTLLLVCKEYVRPPILHTYRRTGRKEMWVRIER